MARRGGRAVQGSGLLNRDPLTGVRGFESHPLRHASLGRYVSQKDIPKFGATMAATRGEPPGSWLRQALETRSL